MVRFRSLFKNRPLANNLNTPLLDYDRYLEKPKGRALLAYLPAPVRDEIAGLVENEFSNRGIARNLPKALNELGYVVDIVSWDDKNYKTNRRYDLLVQHGGINYDQLKGLVKPGGKKIYFSSGSYWQYHNSAEKKRFTNFAERHGFQPPYDRLIVQSEEAANAEADGIIALGNAAVRETYSKFKNVYSLNLGCYPNIERKEIDKNPADTKNSFLFFAGGGAIHKGLDLVIEAFADLPQQLYIVAYIEDGVIPAYKEALKKSNIHYIGPVDFRSEKYYDIMAKCAFAILPSCSEGQPGSMVECLNEGLIPLITKDVHIDVEGFGFLLDQPKITAIERQVDQLATMTDNEIKQRSKSAKQAAASKHSPAIFLQELKSHIKQIVEAKSP
jgi:glycosyltransferase involved in cell wall biosynthesis